MKKKWIAVLLIMSMLLCMTGCSEEYDNTDRQRPQKAEAEQRKNLIGQENFIHMTIMCILISGTETNGKLTTLNCLIYSRRVTKSAFSEPII